MILVPDKLDKWLRAGDATGIEKFFRGSTEPGRQSVARMVKEWCELLELNWRASFSAKHAERLTGKEKIKNTWPFESAANLAALACLSLPQIKSLLRGDRPPLNLIGAVLRERKPVWLDDYAEFLCDQDLHHWTYGWKEVRYLVREGLCHQPKHDNYALGAIHGIWPPFDTAEHLRRKDAGLEPLPQPDLVELLLAEKDWLESSFWRLFEIEGTGEISLANSEKYSGARQGWSEAIAELAKRGVLSRQRLLDATLSALSRDFIQFRAGWFSRFHEVLTPTLEEREKRLPAYFHLLASPIAPTVTFALKAIQTLSKAKPIVASQLAKHIDPALIARSKVAVTGALQLLAGAASREEDFASEAARLATDALLHESTDIQAKALELIERHGNKEDAELRAKLSEIEEHIAPSLRQRLGPWVSNVSRPVLPTASARAPVLSRLDPSRAIEPIQDLDELILSASAVLESPDDPMEIERILDGLARLGTEFPPDFSARTGPLRKRSLQRRGAPATRSATLPLLHRGLAMLFATWTSRSVEFTWAFRQDAKVADEIGFVLQRLVAAGDALLARQPSALWSFPTHLGGWIDPVMLVQRVLNSNANAAVPALHDQILALLRLAPERRDEALKLALGAPPVSPGEFGDALRFVLGDTNVKIGATAALWIAAARSREPYGRFPDLDARHPNLGPDGATPAEYELATRTESFEHYGRVYRYVAGRIVRKPAMPRHVPAEHFPVLMHLRKRELADGSMLRWLGTFSPALRESFFAHGFHPLFHMSDVDRDSHVYLEPLADPFTELHTMGRMVMAIGLALKEANYQSLAIDGFVGAVATGRFNPAEFGDTLAVLMGTGHFPVGRWVNSLRQIAAVSPEHRIAIGSLIESSLQGDPAKAPRDLHKLLELLVEMLAETGAALHPTAREYLRGIRTGGATAKLVRQLL